MLAIIALCTRFFGKKSFANQNAERREFQPISVRHIFNIRPIIKDRPGLASDWDVLISPNLVRNSKN